MVLYSPNKVEELEVILYLTARNVQQNFYETVSDWNVYKADEHVYLKNFVGHALVGPPEDAVTFQPDTAYEYKSKQTSIIDPVFNKIVEHGTQLTESKDVYCGILYISTYDKKSLKTRSSTDVHELLNMIPLFKVQKNINEQNDVKLYTWYVDTEARVYKSWNDYINNNKLPSCTIIAPKDGIYQADLKETWSEKCTAVWIELYDASTHTLMNTLDITGTIVNVGSIGIGIASMFTPIGPSILIGATVTGGISALWAGGKSVQELVDRGTHEQSISVTKAFPAWLGIVSTTVGAASMGGSTLLSKAVHTGTSISKGAQIAHDVLLIGNFCVNIVGIGNCCATMIKKFNETGEISIKDVFFLSTNLLFIYNCYVNIKLAENIIETKQTQLISDLENNLRSKRHRKEFRRLIRNTKENTPNKIRQNEQIIRALNKITDKDAFFSYMVQKRKTFSSTGTKLSFADGQIQINNKILIDPSTLTTFSKESIIALINEPSTFKPNTGMNNGLNNNLANTQNVTKMVTNANKTLFGCTSVPIFRSEISQFERIVNDLRNNPNQFFNLNTLIDAGILIIKCINRIRNLTLEQIEDNLLSAATDFVWEIVKSICSRYIPEFDISRPRYQSAVSYVVTKIYTIIRSSTINFATAFYDYYFNANEFDVEINMEIDAYNINSDGQLLNPKELMTLSAECIKEFINKAVLSTLSQTHNLYGNPTPDVLKFGTSELKYFFNRHLVTVDFKLPDLLPLCNGLLLDLTKFDLKDVMFYKLLVISLQILQRLNDNQIIKCLELADTLTLLWIWVIINFAERFDQTCMFNNMYQNAVINIIIQIYQHQITDPDIWSSALREYRTKKRAIF